MRHCLEYLKLRHRPHVFWDIFSNFWCFGMQTQYANRSVKTTFTCHFWSERAVAARFFWIYYLPWMRLLFQHKLSPLFRVRAALWFWKSLFCFSKLSAFGNNSNLWLLIFMARAPVHVSNKKFCIAMIRRFNIGRSHRHEESQQYLKVLLACCLPLTPRST